MAFARMFLLFAVVGLLLSTPAHSQTRPSDQDIVQALRAGGNVIVIRHGATNEDQADTDPLNPDNIATQRQLSAKGEDAAKALGAAFKQIGELHTAAHDFIGPLVAELAANEATVLGVKKSADRFRRC